MNNIPKKATVKILSGQTNAVNGAEKAFSDIFTFTRSTTGTYFDANGVMQTAAIDARRIDHDPSTGEKLGLLIEEQRTNIDTYSVPTSGQWNAIGGITTYNHGTSPDATITAALSRPNSGTYLSFFHGVATISYTSGTTYTISRFIKASGANRIQITGPTTAFGSAQYANFYLDGDGSVSASAGCDAGIKKCANGWYRVWISVAATSTTTAHNGASCHILSGAETRLPTLTFTGNEGVLVWGSSVESAPFPSSYIATAGSSVTRSADIVVNNASNVIPFSSWYNQVEGCLFTESKAAYNTATTARRIAEISDGSLNNRWFHNIEGSAGNNVSIFVNSGGVTQFSNASSLTSNEFRKFASSVKTDGAYAIGGSIATDATVTMPASVNQLNIGQSYSGNRINGWVKSLRYYPARISNSELQRITT